MACDIRFWVLTHICPHHNNSAHTQTYSNSFKYYAWPEWKVQPYIFSLFCLFSVNELISLYTSSNSINKGSWFATRQHTSTHILALLLRIQNGTKTPQRHVSESSLARFSKPDITSAPLPVLWMQHGRDSTQTDEWSQQTCRSLLLRSAKALLLLGGLRVASRVKWKPSSLKLLQVWPRHVLLGSRWDGATHWGFFLRCCGVWSESLLNCSQHWMPSRGGWVRPAVYFFH